MSSIVGLEMPNAWRTGQVTDPNFDISADQLNITTNREMWVPSGTIDWGGTLHQNALDPISLQDLATKNYVDLSGANLWSTFPAQQDVDYVNTFTNINLIDPTNPQDAATKAYVDANAGATDLDGLSDVTITTPTLNEILQFNGSIWINQVLSVPAGSLIVQDDSSVSVLDTGANGRVETKIDNVLKSTLNGNLYDITVPISMNSQQINSLGTPAVSTDAATKGYVDTEIAGLTIPTELDDLTDVTITTPAINEILVNNGAGQWVNQTMGKAQLPSTIAYEDEVNTFTQNNFFNAGLTLGSGQIIDYTQGTAINILSQTFTEQIIDPASPALNQSVMFLDDGADFNSPNPVWEVLIDRDGVIEKKPVVTSETVFALRNFSNGMFTQETGTKIITDGGIGIRVQLFNENVPNGSYEVVLNGQLWIIADPDTTLTVGNTIDLSVGTDIAPTKQWVWLEIDTNIPTLKSSSVSFPLTGDFAVVGTFLLQSQASVLADGAYAVNSPDYEIFDEASRGHLAHLNDRISQQDSLYVSGIALTTVPAVAVPASNVTYTSTSGISIELHTEDIEAFDITTGIALVENEGTQTSLEVTRVNDIGLDMVGLTCANQATVIANNDRINVVVYTVHNDDEPNQTNYGINLPFDTYATDADAIADVSGFAIKSIPLNLRGISLLIAEIVIGISGGAATFEVLSVKDLRGQVPGAAGGSGGGSGGVSQLNDLTDVTINTPLIDQILEFDGAGQWVNVANPAGLLAVPNVWLGYQDYNNISAPVPPGIGVGRFFVETIDPSNDGLFIWLRQAGGPEKVRIA